jgi:hypothetical protein
VGREVGARPVQPVLCEEAAVTTTRTTLLARLESLPRDLRAAEEALLEAAAHYAEARLALEGM